MFNEHVAGKIFTWAIEHMQMAEVGSKGWLGGDCPHCGKEGKFGINVEGNISNCFVCGTKMKLIPLIQEVHNLKTYQEVYKLLDGYEGFKINIDHNRSFEVEQKIGDELLPEGFKLIGMGKSTIAQVAVRVMKNRGYKIGSLLALGIGYTTKGKFKNRIIIPYYEGGKVVYFNARAIIDIGPKYENPKEEEVGIGKGWVIYNIDVLRYSTKVWIFEGVLNAITIGQNATNIGGKVPSPWQLNQYIKSPCQKFVIALDDDAYTEALDFGLKLTAAGKMVKILRFPKGKDANDLGKKATLKLEKSHSYMKYNDVLKLKLNYKEDDERTEYTYNRSQLIKNLRRAWD